ncbi:uncharacterized protein CCR75_009811 [Bremia lactucae]|uniref:Uncharacterized protein n=1 Tax=Bremia lactucae TaxID=4779 RepID=A0A976P0A9_BRELC|nr:hypothetical protein CCR75_009811 [Bremia lactucae]
MSVKCKLATRLSRLNLLVSLVLLACSKIATVAVAYSVEANRRFRALPSFEATTRSQRNEERAAVKTLSKFIRFKKSAAQKLFEEEALLSYLGKLKHKMMFAKVEKDLLRDQKWWIEAEGVALNELMRDAKTFDVNSRNFQHLAFVVNHIASKMPRIDIRKIFLRYVENLGEAKAATIFLKGEVTLPKYAFERGVLESLLTKNEVSPADAFRFLAPRDLTDVQFTVERLELWTTHCDPLLGENRYNVLAKLLLDRYDETKLVSTLNISKRQSATIDSVLSAVELGRAANAK